MPYSPATGLPIESQTVSQMVDRVLALDEGTRLYLLAPIVRARKGEYRRSWPSCKRRASSASRWTAPSTRSPRCRRWTRSTTHDIDVVVDRIVVRPDLAARLADSIETALKLADGLAVAEFADRPLPPEETAEGGAANKSANDTHERILFSEKFACPVSGFTIPEIEPRLFSFNNPFGACPTCDGLGSQRAIDANSSCRTTTSRCAAAPSRPGRNRPRPIMRRRWKALGKAYGFKLGGQVQGPFRGSAARPSCAAPASARWTFHYDDGLRSYKTPRPSRV